MSNMEQSTTDEQEELDGLNEIVSFTEDVLERMDAKSIAGHLTLVKRVGVILITFTSILCFATTMQIVLSSVTQTNTNIVNVQNVPVAYFIEQKYALTEEVYLTVCSMRNTSVIEMRKFYNGQPTSDGLFLSLVQWTFLKRIIPFVDKTLHIARV
jgi:hypothetical protein